MNWQDVLADLRHARPRLQPLVADTSLYLHRAMTAGRAMMFEGAQGTLLDIDHGTYPFVTSSNATAGGAAPASASGPRAIGTVLGVAKAYTTRVGEGPLPTELTGADGRPAARDGTGIWRRRPAVRGDAAGTTPSRCATPCASTGSTRSR